VTFATEDAKDRAIQDQFPEEWVVDDVFNGVTVLYSPENRDDTEEAEIECVLLQHIFSMCMLTVFFS